MEIEDDIRPFRETDYRKIRNDRGENLELKVFEIIPLIPTDSTVRLIVRE